MSNRNSLDLPENEQREYDKIIENLYANISALDKMIILGSMLSISILTVIFINLRSIISISNISKITFFIALSSFVFVLIFNVFAYKLQIYISNKAEEVYLKQYRTDLICYYKLNKRINNCYLLLFISGLVSLLIFFGMVLLNFKPY